MPLAAHEAAAAAALIAAAGLWLNAAELLKRPSVLDHYFVWTITRTRYSWLLKENGLWARLTSTPVLRPLLLLQCVAAVASSWMLWQQTPGAWCAVGLVFGVILLVRLRLTGGQDGADQMQTVLWAGLLGFTLAQSTTGETIALGFIAAQSVLSYVTSGVAKAISPIWRRGSAVGDILRMDTYGLAWTAKLGAVPWLSWLASWFTIVWEAAGPLLIFFGPEAALVFLALGVLFHLGVAVSMGLNHFFFAFCATYPVLYWAASFFA